MTTSKSTFLSFFFLFLAFAAATSLICAQDKPKNPDKGFQPGGGYAVSDIETINTTNGNLILNIPIAALPKGRGEVGRGVTLIYNSKLYETAVEALPDHSNQITPQNWLVPSYTTGWNYAHQMYSLDVKSRFQTEVTVQCGTFEANMMHQYLWKVAMYMPDGSKKEFRPAGYTDFLDDGFFSVTANGWVGPGCTGGQGGYVTTGPMTYYSVDGSYLKLVVEHVNGGSIRGDSNPWTLYMPDGSRVTGGVGLPQYHYDRNNNRVAGLTDDLGRSVQLITNALPNEDHVIAKGVDGEDLLWKIKWKNISVNKSYETTGAGGGIGRGTTSNQTMQMTFKVVEKITLPDQTGGLTYEFGYNGVSEGGNGWGELSYMKLPSGVEVEYDFVTPLITNTETVLKNYPQTKSLTFLSEYGGQSTPVTETTSYWISNTGATITAPDGSVTIQSHGSQTYNNQFAGLVHKIEHPNGGITERIWGFNLTPWSAGNASHNSYIKTEFNTISDSLGQPILTGIKDNVVDPNGNVVEVREYDWVPYSSVPRSSGKPTGIPVGAPLKRITLTEYNNSAIGNSGNAYYSFASPNNRQVVQSLEVRDGNQTPVSRSELSYDNPSTRQTRPYSNPLTLTNSITTSATYNQYGMPLTTTDANANVTAITYGSVGGPGGNVTDLYPTQTVIAYGTAVARTSSAVYDFYTGLVTVATDVDNNLSVVTEYDDLGRPTKLRNAAGTALESWVRTEYDDVNRRVVVRSDLDAVGDGRKIAIQHFDQLARVRLIRTLENAAVEDPANETHGIKVETRYKTVAGYTYQLTSNPFRAATAAAETDPTMGWTLSTAWSSGRRSEVETFSGSGLPTAFSGSNTNSTGIVRTDIDAERTLVTDQAGKKRISNTNALGQLKEVWEILGASETGSESVSFPNTSIAHGFKTTYSYDPLNSLTTVTQGSQTRTFTYSSLSRLLSAANLESGTISYDYDPNGNLTGKTDGRGVVTNYVYDQLNRVTDRTYTSPSPTPSNYQPTPGVEYSYSLTAPSVGKLIKVESSVSTTEYTGFDILGRVTAHKQTTDGTDYTTAYTYNVSGALIEQTYPSGRVVKNTLDVDGSLSQVQSRRSGETYRNFANGFIYNPAGAVTTMRMGNGKWENTVFNSRRQPTMISLGNGVASQNLLKLEYGYGTTQNNGNVLSQTITVPGVTQPFVQAYTYDSLNRLADATETQNSSQTWKQTFSYDRYGNRNFNTSGINTTTLPQNFDPDIYNPTISTSNNRFNSGQGYTYDSSGNTTADAEGRAFVYDAENKQIEVLESSVTIGEYFYDGEGKRVKKVGPAGETTVFVYDAGGKLIGEYSTVVQSGSNAMTVFTTNDPLSSPRISTDSLGNVVSRHDYHPFGDEIVRANYGSDTIRKRFTGYERDGETGLDFAQARYYATQQGRFNSPDLFLGSGRIVNPQTWNRYVYVLNNPLIFTDPTGLWEWGDEAGGTDTDEELEKNRKHRDRDVRRRAERALKFRKNFRESLLSVQNAAKSDRLTQSQRDSVARAANAYGSEGDGNNVIVSFKGQGTGTGASVDGRQGDLIFANFSLGQDGNELAISIAHEGIHVADNQAFDSVVRGGTGMNSPFDLPQDIMLIDSEVAAYHVSSYTAQALGVSPVYDFPNETKYHVWNSGWRQADRDRKRAAGIKNLLDTYYSDPSFRKRFSEIEVRPQF